MILLWAENRKPAVIHTEPGFTTSARKRACLKTHCARSSASRNLLGHIGNGRENSPGGMSSSKQQRPWEFPWKSCCGQRSRYLPHLACLTPLARRLARGMLGTGSSEKGAYANSFLGVSLARSPIAPSLSAQKGPSHQVEGRVATNII